MFYVTVQSSSTNFTSDGAYYCKLCDHDRGKLAGKLKIISGNMGMWKC